ncbi:MAG TPA: hypothetical protein P5513_08465 [Candidatus Diapherotrites archaeon]|nr:hypothetical protein [Candidatus Diapherotrites archaeon]
MSEQENYNAFFNPDVELDEPKSGQSIEYNPSASKGKNNVYQSIIRFIPWWKNPKHGSIQEKWVSFLVDPVTNRGRYVDCPSSVGKPSPLQDIFWKLKKSESVQEQKLADIFSRRHSYASLIQVIRDQNAPELEGKILVWRYGVKIWEKINAELKPIVQGVEKHDPFDILNGKAFALVITKVSGYNNYDQSKFIDKRIPLMIPVEKDGKRVFTPINSSTDKKMVFEWVKNNSPDLGNYGYREWDQEIYDYVNHVITAVTGQATISHKYENIVNRDKLSSNSNVKKSSDKKEVITSSEISIEDINLDEEEGLNVSDSGIPDLEIPDIPEVGGISGDLDDIISNT